MRRLIALLLCVTFILAGCKGTRVNVMGFETHGKPIQASEELSGDEKVGVIVVLAAAVGLGIAGYAIAND